MQWPFWSSPLETIFPIILRSVALCEFSCFLRSNFPPFQPTWHHVGCSPDFAPVFNPAFQPRNQLDLASVALHKTWLRVSPSISDDHRSHSYIQNMPHPVTPEQLAKDPTILLTTKFSSGSATPGKRRVHFRSPGDLWGMLVSHPAFRWTGWSCRLRGAPFCDQPEYGSYLCSSSCTTPPLCPAEHLWGASARTYLNHEDGSTFLRGSTSYQSSINVGRNFNKHLECLVAL